MTRTSILRLAASVLAISCAGSSNAQSLLQTLRIPALQQFAEFGSSVSNVPDVDGDGREDLLVGAPTADLDGFSNAGEAYLYSGTTGALLHTLRSPNPQVLGRFGWSVSGVPDADGDGRGDLLIGAQSETHNDVSEAGRAYLFSGATGSLLRTLQAPILQPFANFGYSVSGVPDANGDGRGDLLIGARNEAHSGFGSAGRAYLFSGATGSYLRTLQAPAPSASALFGHAVSATPDVDGDGRSDLLVGAYNETHDNLLGAGRAYVFSGATGNLLRTLQAPTPQASTWFGRSVSGVPDADGDGRGDLLISAILEDHSGLSNAGSAYLFSGATGGHLRTIQAPTPQADAGFGQSVSGVPDVDGDVRGDLLVSAHSEDHTSLINAGRAYLFSGATGSLLRTLQAPTPRAFDFFGQSVFGVGDVDGDGRGDLFAGNPGEDFSGVASSGGAYLFGGPEAALTIRGLAGTGNDTGWRMMASPVMDAARSDFHDDLSFGVTTGSVFYTFENGAWTPDGVDTLLTPGKGFILYFFDDPKEPVEASYALDVPGIRPGWDIPVYGLPQDQTWHLLGNPYAQSFDLDYLNIGDLTGFQASVQVWDPLAGTYVLFSQGGSQRVLSPWQGFFAERTTLQGGSTTLVFDAGGRTSGGRFVGSRQPATPLPPGSPSLVATHVPERRTLGLRLVGRDAGGAEVVRDEAAALLFHPDAQEGWDVWDASKLEPVRSVRYALLSLLGERERRTISRAQASYPFDPGAALSLPVALKLKGFSGEMTLAWPTMENIPASWRMTLLDANTGEHVDLQAAQEHTFHVAEGEAEFPARFTLRIEAGTSVGAEGTALPSAVALLGSSPNPFRRQAVIRYALPEAGPVRLAVYDLLGREVAVLVDGTVTAGRHEAVWQAEGQSSGVYLYRLEAAGRVLTGRMTLVR